jgi:hypothetical protein
VRANAGAACLVVSGIVDAERGIDRELLPNLALTAIRLRADSADLRRRVESRARPGQDFDETASEAEAFDRHEGPCIDTTGLSVNDVVKRLEGWSPEYAVAPIAISAPELPGRILRVSGPREDGKSMIGWRIYRQMRLAGTRSAFVDAGQLGILRPADAADPGNRRLRAANLAAVWRNFRAAVAECLVAAEPLPGTEDGIPGNGAAAERPII